ncbi:MAG: UDP-N-acetylmuramoyl-tripeptide--D-alanyl-D-alanine ligase [Acidimicrobiia bacterium]|nr:UDP-N-acetylmuramoyl-tripeptide--D-alanyl-D-alanine ligase [Acidimicrobiia bacterium]
MRMRLSDVAAATGGRLIGADVLISGTTIDSRTISGGELFVPIVAARDGHDFVEAAVAAGAAAHLTADASVVHGDAVVVDDTERALTALGDWARDKLPDRVVGITGSVGKTSTKDLVAAALEGSRRVHVSYRSFNNELGVPLTLLGAPDDVDVVVVEMGARGAGHIAALCRVARPTIGVVTRVGAAHTELFGSIESVADAKAELIDALPVWGTAVLNVDDPAVAAMAARAAGDVVAYGMETGDVRAVDITLDDRLRPSFTVVSPWGDHHVRLGTAGLQNVSNALGALAVAGIMGVGIADAAAGLGTVEMSPWRMDVRRSRCGALVINDAYNANPMSVDAALRSLAAVTARRKVAVLGLMAELGDEHDRAHADMGELARSLGIEVISVDEPGYGGTAVTDIAGAAEALGELDADDAVLVKGSRVAGLERLADRLLAD